jgi:hypothetical protein
MGFVGRGRATGRTTTVATGFPSEAEGPRPAAARAAGRFPRPVPEGFGRRGRHAHNAPTPPRPPTGAGLDRYDFDIHLGDEKALEPAVQPPLHNERFAQNWIGAPPPGTPHDQRIPGARNGPAPVPRDAQAAEPLGGEPSAVEGPGVGGPAAHPTEGRLAVQPGERGLNARDRRQVEADADLEAYRRRAIQGAAAGDIELMTADCATLFIFVPDMDKGLVPHFDGSVGPPFPAAWEAHPEGPSERDWLRLREGHTLRLKDNIFYSWIAPGSCRFMTSLLSGIRAYLEPTLVRRWEVVLSDGDRNLGDAIRSALQGSLSEWEPTWGGYE